MNIVDEETQAWIKTDEGLKLNTYIDTTGNLTVGWGRNLRNGINIEEAELMFQNDLKNCVDELNSYEWYEPLPKNVKKALINMNFNLGIHNLLKFTGMINALKAKDYTKAAQEALNSLWAKQVGSRAKYVAVMIRQG
jgi:lysozyme